MAQPPWRLAGGLSFLPVAHPLLEFPSCQGGWLIPEQVMPESKGEAQCLLSQSYATCQYCHSGSPDQP